jgi:polysaccharide export outer membrane protein
MKDLARLGIPVVALGIVCLCAAKGRAAASVERVSRLEKATVLEASKVDPRFKRPVGHRIWYEEDEPKVELLVASSTQAEQKPPTEGEAVGDGKPTADVVPARHNIEPEGIDPELFFGRAPASSDYYQLGPDDVLEIKVFEMDQFDRSVRVSGDGRINMPLIGWIRVQGLVPEEAAARLTEALQEQFVQNPQVSVFVKEFNSRELSLLGAVDKPATYPLLGRRSLLQVLADAGGVTEDADEVLYVFRQSDDGRRARLLVPLSELLLKGNPHWDIWLQPGDVVSVPPQKLIRVSVLGAVEKPGIYELRQDETSLLKALASAEGLHTRASRKGIQIQRLDDSGKEIILNVNLGDILSGKRPDVPLQEGDVVFVNERFF